MKNIIGIAVAGLLIISSCSGPGELQSSREERKAIDREAVEKAVETQKMLIKVDRFYPRRGPSLTMNPNNNYIIISEDDIRINLGYLGRSQTIMPVAAINMQGEIYSRTIGSTKKGGYDTEYKVGQNNEKFTLYMTISDDGWVNLTINNARLDVARYSGRLKRPGN